jgi:uncharacterized protein YybS (DUF2232 family)
MFTVAGTPSILGSVASLALPLPHLYYYSKLGRFWGMFVFAASLGIATLTFRFFNYSPVILHLCLLGSLGPILSEIVRKNYSIEKTVLRATAALIFLGSLVLVYYSTVTWENPLTMIMSYISSTVAENIDAYAQLGGAPEQIDLLKRHSEQMSRIFFGIFPSIVTVGTLFFVWCNVMAGRALFVRYGMWYPEFGDLSRWELRDRYVWIVIVAGLSLILPVGKMKVIGLNVLIVMLFLYLLQGLSVVQFYFDTKRVPTALRLIGYFLIFAQQFVMLLIVGLGLIDVWADFRKLHKAQQ